MITQLRRIFLLMSLTICVLTVCSQDTMYVTHNGKIIEFDLSLVDSIFFELPNSESYARDIDGNIYKTVTIGEQEWFAENLRTTRWNNGTELILIEGDYQWERMQKAYSYTWRGDDSATYAIPYGAYYNWFCIEWNNTKALCPVGWRVPTDEDWKKLETYLGTDTAKLNEFSFRGESARLLKNESIDYWVQPNNATNETGFNAIPAGIRSGEVGEFRFKGLSAYFWSSSRISEHQSEIYYQMDHDKGTLGRQYFVRAASHGMSVRCMRDL
jgi:uncharacterized protein (TIGR02145 family)